MELGLSNFFLFFSSALSLYLFFFALSRKTTSLNISFGFFALTCALYAFGYSFELMSQELEEMLLWSRIQYLGIPFQSALFIIFSLSYTGNDRFLTRPRVLLIFLIPVITFIARWTNRFHFLFYLNPAVFNTGKGALLSFDAGPLYFLHITYLIIALIISTILLGRFLYRAFSVYRNQTILILSALAVQWAALLLYLFRLGPEHYDINPFMFSFSALLYAVGIFRFSLFNIVPVARATVFDEMKDAVLVFDSEMRLLDYNKRCFALFDEIVKKNIGQNVRTLFTAYPVIVNMITDHRQSELELMGEEQAEPLFFRLSLQELKSRSGRLAGSILTFHDITEQKKFLAELETLAAIDLLTGIYNRRQLLNQAEIEVKRALRTGKPLSLMIIDLDHFKAVNDNHGHHGGDEVLRAFSDLVLRNIRDIDIFGRYGGEEFIVVMPDTPGSTAFDVAERLRSKTERMMISCAGREIRITVSIGLTGSQGGQISLDKLIQDADKALYAAKENGRNTISPGPFN